MGLRIWIVYELLQNAENAGAKNLPKGIRKAFMDAVAKTITKGVIEHYYEPVRESVESSKNIKKISTEHRAEGNTMDKFAVIDTETNWYDEVMSIGVVVADTETKNKIDSVYYIIDPEYRVGGMYSNELQLEDKNVHISDRKHALMEIKEWLNSYDVQKLFAYNASFDKKHLPEYSEYEWYDIMRLAAYRQYNWAIPDLADCCKTGRLKRGYGVEDVLKILGKNKQYCETHNAVRDAHDELRIMQLLGHEIKEYDIALISNKKNRTEKSKQSKGKDIYDKAQNKTYKENEKINLFTDNNKSIE